MPVPVKRVYCSYFDSRFLARGLALHASLKRHVPDLFLWLLCLDEPCYRELARLDLEGVRLLRLGDLERHNPALLQVKATRTPLEYALTCTPLLPLYVFESCPEAELVAYLDADLYFFSSPEPLFAELGAGSIAITPHRYPAAFKHWERLTGVYNDGWVCFRRDANALACLRWWRERCLEWCHNRHENGRFTEQQYLDEWPRLFPGVVSLRHPGANAGPWNLGGLAVDDAAGRLLVNGEPLLFFHFSGFKQIAPWLYDLNLADFHVRPGRAARRAIFAPYLRELRASSRRLSGLAEFTLKSGGRKDEGLPRQPWALRLGRAFRGIAGGHWAFFVGGRAL